MDRGLMLSRGRGVWGSTITSASGREPQTPLPRDSINPPIVPLSFSSFLTHSSHSSIIPVILLSFYHFIVILSFMTHSGHFSVILIILLSFFLYLSSLSFKHTTFTSVWQYVVKMSCEWWSDIRMMEWHQNDGMLRNDGMCQNEL